MTDTEYTEPTNEQLANFLSVYTRNIPDLRHLNVSPAVLELVLERNPEHRATALRHHRAFQKQIDHLTAKVQAGELPCEHIRSNGRHCPNYNEPGSHYCGLHKDEEE